MSMLIHSEVSDVTAEALYTMAAEEGISRAALIRRILEETTETKKADLTTNQMLGGL